MSTLSLDSSVSLFEPAVARLAPAPVPSPRADRTARHPAHPCAGGGRHSVTTASPGGTAAGGCRARPPGVRRVDARARPSSRARSDWSPCASSARRAAAAAVTIALAVSSANGGSRQALLASLSVRGLAFAAILCAAWGFQDRPGWEPLATTRAWYGTAVVLAFAHAAWLESTLPGPWNAHLGTSLASLRARRRAGGGPGPARLASGPADAGECSRG